MKIIQVWKQRIQSNQKHGTRLPAIAVREGRKSVYTNCARIMHEGKEVARVVYNHDKPLSCGARCWIETDCEVIND